MKIYTKRGDTGETDLFGGSRVKKSHPQVMAYGAVDAANSAIGFAACAQALPIELGAPLESIMSDMFDLGAELATAQKTSAHEKLQEKLDSHVDLERIAELERLIDEADKELLPMRSFVLPTGCDAAARFHLARTATRQAEQRVVALIETGFGVRDEVVGYLNRLSDLLFIWARLCNHREHIPDVPWKAKKVR